MDVTVFRYAVAVSEWPPQIAFSDDVVVQQAGEGLATEEPEAVAMFPVLWLQTSEIAVDRGAVTVVVT